MSESRDCQKREMGTDTSGKWGLAKRSEAETCLYPFSAEVERERANYRFPRFSPWGFAYSMIYLQGVTL